MNRNDPHRTPLFRSDAFEVKTLAQAMAVTVTPEAGTTTAEWWHKETRHLVYGFRADHCICLWVIQHAFNPADVIARIRRGLKAGGLLYALNQRTRSVPTDQGWIDDGYDVAAGLRDAFSEENSHALAKSATTPELAAITMIQILRKEDGR